MLYDEPESNKFIAAIQRLKRRRQRVARQSRLARQRVRTAIRKLRG